MAARQQYPTPHEQLRDLAIIARAEGLPFDVFWQRATLPGEKPVTWATPERERPDGCVIWPRDTTDRNMNREIVASKEVREGWRRAYEGWAPTRADRALTALAPGMSRLLDEMDAVDEAGELPVAV